MTEPRQYDSIEEIRAALRYEFEVAVDDLLVEAVDVAEGLSGTINVYLTADVMRQIRELTAAHV